MSKLISSTTLCDTLELSECSDGFWLYDETRGMNLSMSAKSSTDAFVEALTYYQNRLREVEQEHIILKKKVYAFVDQFIEESDD